MQRSKTSTAYFKNELTQNDVDLAKLWLTFLDMIKDLLNMI